MKPIAITGLGIVSSLGVGWGAFSAALADEGVVPFTRSPRAFSHAPHPALRVAEVPGFDASVYLGDKGLRNNDRLTRLALVAARLCVEHAGLKNSGGFCAYDADSIGLVASTAYGSTEAIAENNRIAQLEDPRYLNPARFPNTVINSAFGYVSIWEDLRALNVTVTNGPTGSLDAIFCAITYLESDRARAVLAGGVEALSELLWASMLRVGALKHVAPEGDALGEGISLGEGGALVAMERSDDARSRGAKVWAEVVGYGASFVDEPSPHLVSPSAGALVEAIREALRDAAVDGAAVDLVVSGLNGDPRLDDVERRAIREALPGVAVVAPKARLGETLGASGALGLACAISGFESGVAHDLFEGVGPATLETVVITALGFYGNASALVVRRAK